MTKINGENSSKKKLDVLLSMNQVATMEEMKGTLDTDVSMTVYRALKRLGYRTSYSHSGRYYALKKTIEFDEHGLWTARSIWFSRHGTLMKTLERSVSDSECGYFAHELEELLHVGVRESLLRLVQQGRISRQRVSRSYLYCSKSASVRRRQLAERQSKEGDIGIQFLVGPEQIPDEIKAAIVLFSALLDERQRRLFAGVEALQFGRNAERWIADLLDIHYQTVAKGRQELLDRDVSFTRIRKEGAGRPPVEKKLQRSSKKSKP
jgi:hypothetical protein